MVVISPAISPIRQPDNVSSIGGYPSSMPIFYEHSAAKRIGGALGYSTTLSSANTCDMNVWIAVTSKSGGT
jgi:hypothetical protein